MSDGFTLDVEDDFSDRLDGAQAALRADLLSASQALAAALLTRAREKASGDMLKVHSGDYLASLTSSVSSGDDGVVAEMSSDSPQAVILEYGGIIGPHDIVPDAAKAMRFEGGAGEIFAKVVHFTGARIAPRPILHSSLDEMSDEIVADMKAVQRAFVASLS